MALIVVGVDGSDASKEALRWALDEAELRTATLRAVHAWTYPPIFGEAYVLPEVLGPSSLQDQARQRLDDVVAEVAGTTPRAYIEPVVREGPAAQVLIDAAGDADLLVVGSRGHGGFAGLLLGSVSQQCAQHAPCAVTIVRARHEQAPQ